MGLIENNRESACSSKGPFVFLKYLPPITSSSFCIFSNKAILHAQIPESKVLSARDLGSHSTPHA